MAFEQTRLQRLAVLIDADNASPRIVQGLFEELAAIGEASVRRIYGDFSSGRLKSWSEVLARYAIIPQQSYANIAGKNASDIALVIDAMDLLHTGRFDAFCLVSSDSDFTRLAARIREQGVDVFGFGEQKTPESFRMACKRFIYTENLLSPSPPANPDSARGTPSSLEPAALPKQEPKNALPHIHQALAQMEDANGWYPLGGVGSRLYALMPDFDPRSFGCPKLATLIEKSEAFDIRRDNLVVYIRPQASISATAMKPALHA